MSAIVVGNEVLRGNVQYFSSPVYPCCIVSRDNKKSLKVVSIMFNSICNPIQKVIKINVDVSRFSRLVAGLGSSTVDQVLKYIKYPKYIPSTSTGQLLIYL